VTLIRLLSAIPPFSSLNDAQLASVVTCCRQHDFAAGEAIYQQNTPAHKLYIIIEGLVSLDDVVPDTPAMISFERRGPKEIFGGASLLGFKAYSLTANCLEPTSVIEIDIPCLEEIFAQHPEVGLRIMAEVATIYFKRYDRAKQRLYNVFREIPVRLICR